MGIRTRTFKNTDGTIQGVAEGRPAGFMVLTIFGVLFSIVAMVTFAGGSAIGIVPMIIGTIFLLAGRAYGKRAISKAAQKAANDAQRLEDQNKDKIEFEEFKKWKEQNQKKMVEDPWK